MASYFDKNKDGKITKEGKFKTKTELSTYLLSIFIESYFFKTFTCF